MTIDVEKTHRYIPLTEVPTSLKNLDLQFFQVVTFYCASAVGILDLEDDSLIFGKKTLYKRIIIEKDSSFCVFKDTQNYYVIVCVGHIYFYNFIIRKRKYTKKAKE